MAQSFRHPEIMDIVRRDGMVTVEDLAGHFNVTHQTIRRDLSDLAESGKLERVHGGAILPPVTGNIGYEDRRSINHAGKIDIARACVADLPEECSIFLNIGTTTEAVATALLSRRNIMVVTNNLNVANILAAADGAQVVVAGGALRRSDGGLVGTLTSQTISQFKFDFAVIGCSALDFDGDLLDFDILEVGVSQTIIRQARKVFLVADHTKFQRHAPVRIGSLSEVDSFYTDRPVPAALQDMCDEWQTKVVVADGD
ncbi:DeoR/GlpR family DNA-binding transcription regulator [Oceaniglobus roseus]|uniref:DeoR/GlpR family DNA-binding transcription regulator n=1 Tax=Oceaniglobus roseus TaxID=1737570 RepID=UPI000C7F1B97|nr:DeoR/GlpR family DNA-binding transcription regulator [Kandeliimicrobium roseum]